VTDKGTGAENLIWLAKRQGGRADPSGLAADDILAALTGRIAELEARVTAILADVASEPPPAEPKQARAFAQMPDSGAAADAPLSTHVELIRASEERRMLANEMRLLRETIQEARLAQPPAAAPAKAPAATDLRSAVGDEMRSLLSELLADFRSRAPAPAPVEQVIVKSETAAAARTVEIIVEEARALPVVDVIAPEPAPIVEQFEEPPAATIEARVDVETTPVTEASASTVEDIEVLVRPNIEPIIESPVADLYEPEPAAAIREELEELEDLYPAESASAIETVDVEVALPEPSAPVIDEPVSGPAEPIAPIVEDYVEAPSWPDVTPTVETFDIEATPAEPMVDDVVELAQPDAPAEPDWIEAAAPTETVEPVEAASGSMDPIVNEYVQDVAPEYLTHEPPPAVDERLAALWDAAAPPPETVITPEPEPAASFITEEIVADSPPPGLPEFVVEEYPPQELAPEQTVDYVPPPLIESAPPTSLEFAAEPAMEQPASTQSFSSLYPELTIADDKGLHEIQVVISPIHSFPRLIETERRIRALSTVNALHLRDFRNGVATLTVSVGEAISPAEFGAVIQMLESLHLRLEGTTQSGVELRAEDEPATE
jgi:hypothetical protein